MAVAIVLRPLIRIDQDGIGLACLFEGILGRRVVRISVRVEAHRKASIGLLDLAPRGGPGDLENDVVIAFGHRF